MQVSSGQGDTTIEPRPAMPPPKVEPAGAPDQAPGSMRGVIVDFFAGKLRRRFYGDVARFSSDPDATRQVAAGYMSLASALGWLVSLVAMLSLNPSFYEAHALAVVNALGGCHGFLQIRRRRDPRVVVDWLVLVYLASVAILSFRHAGIIAPIVLSLPALAGVATLYLRAPMRAVVLVLGVFVFAFSVLTATGIIGIPSPYSPLARSLMGMLTLLFSTIALGGIAWMAGIARDYAVEQLTAANQTIVENASRSRVALEAARVGLWDVPNAEVGRFHVSESFQTVTGYSAEEFDSIFGNLEKFVHAEDIVSLREAFALGQKRMSRLRVDFRLMTKQRGYRWFSARARYSPNPDGTIRISGSLQDINFIKAAEEALRAGRDRAREASKAKSDFIAVMSHEVRTPLNAILGSVEVLKRNAHDQETSELIALIDDAGRGLLTIVSDLLDVSKIDAGKVDIVYTPTDLTALLRRTIDFWRAQAGNKGLTLKVDCAEADEALLMIDAGRVRQIIGNLVSNAIKFTDTGAVTATLATRLENGGRVGILLSVIDTGPGVPDAVAESIFAPFEQGPSDASRGGTGLGLFISRRLASLMGGDLTLEPTQHGGAHFRLSLHADRAESAGAQTTPAAADPLWTGKRVLCVDDNESNRRIAALLLGKFGIDLTSCASGPEAIDICAIREFDVLLMDIVMPEMDGIETLRCVRANPECLNRNTPAIALTAKLSPEDIAAYTAAGFNGIAAKPINVRELTEAIAPFMAGAVAIRV